MGEGDAGAVPTPQQGASWTWDLISGPRDLSHPGSLLHLLMGGCRLSGKAEGAGGGREPGASWEMWGMLTWVSYEGLRTLNIEDQVPYGWGPSVRSLS